MEYNDDRTPEQKKRLTWLVIGTDSFMSGWGGAKGGNSFAAWACQPKDRNKVLQWVSSRGEMKRVREHNEAYSGKYRPGSSCVHLHIYDVEPGHPALC